MMKLDNQTLIQINQCIDLLTGTLKHDLLGVYLYGSAIVGGLQKYSDIDLFVVVERATTEEEKTELVKNLPEISGIYMKDIKLPIELTIVVKSDVNPWRYPPTFDFQYGEWLRAEFQNGIIEPWASKSMPDLALLITQVLLASEILFGLAANQLLCSVPYRDFMQATKDGIPTLMSELESDPRNVLLTCARIWSTVQTDTIRSKPEAADWAINHLPDEYQPVIRRARSICIGQENEYWHDLRDLIKPCAAFMLSQIHQRFKLIESDGYINKLIRLKK